ncbi:MAG TPA: hypothetical protein VF756_05905, partial [Thermoanaerobaculia bacterium]
MLLRGSWSNCSSFLRMEIQSCWPTAVREDRTARTQVQEKDRAEVPAGQVAQAVAKETDQDQVAAREEVAVPKVAAEHREEQEETPEGLAAVVREDQAVAAPEELEEVAPEDQAVEEPEEGALAEAGAEEAGAEEAGEGPAGAVEDLEHRARAAGARSRNSSGSFANAERAPPGRRARDSRRTKPFAGDRVSSGRISWTLEDAVMSSLARQDRWKIPLCAVLMICATTRCTGAAPAADRNIPLPQESAGVFIGIEKFSYDFSLANVRFAVNDAVDLAYALSIERGLLPANRVLLLLAGEPGEGSQERLAQLLA